MMNTMNWVLAGSMNCAGMLLDGEISTASFLSPLLKNQSGDYANAHRAVIAECDKMLAASEMWDEALGWLLLVGLFVDLLEFIVNWHNNGSGGRCLPSTL